ncbi:hypothetical protein INR49_017697 [Caranx melampygus]|nr:hypothetical protein INR49_017697 [Caranx melampygus]
MKNGLRMEEPPLPTFETGLLESSVNFSTHVAVDLECTGVNELADGLDGVRVALDHLLGDGLGTAVVAVDPHDGSTLPFKFLNTHMSTGVPYPACPTSMEHSMISGASCDNLLVDLEADLAAN